MKVTVHTLRAFAKTETGGNPAGICLHADSLSDTDMQRIAQKVGFSETAFVMASDKADVRVRFFTPTNEINLCGHATIATFYLLAKKGMLTQGTYTQETKAGILGIEIADNGLVFMHQNPPQFLGTLGKDAILECLGVSLDGVDTRLPVEIITTGVPCIIVPLVSLTTLLNVKPDREKIRALTAQYNNSLLYAFTSETQLKQSTAHGRMFAPMYGVDEESATGMANGALACYLFKHHKVSDPSNLIFEQGYSMNMPSEIFGRLALEHNTITDVIIGGTAIITKEMEISL